MPQAADHAMTIPPAVVQAAVEKTIRQTGTNNTDLALKLGVTRKTVARWRGGGTAPAYLLLALEHLVQSHRSDSAPEMARG